MISTPQKILLIASGGALGAGLRYSFILLSQYLGYSGDLAWVIMAENIIGSFLLGSLSGWLLMRKGQADSKRMLFLGTGLLGSFTTFSTFSLDIIYLFEDSVALMLAYTIGSPALGLIFVFAGIGLVRKILPKKGGI